VGGCLTIAEQKNLLKKTGICIKEKTFYDIHEILVTCCESDNRLSRKLGRLLAKKFNKNAGWLLTVDQESFMACWDDCVADGNFYEALWAASSRCDLNERFRRKIFGDVHMAMHFSLEHLRKARSEIAAFKRNETSLRNERKEIIQEIKSLRKEIKGLEAKNHELQVRLDAAYESNEDMKKRLVIAQSQNNRAGLDQKVASLKEQTRELSSIVEKQKKNINGLTKENLSIAQKCEHLTSANLQLQNYARSLIDGMLRTDSCDENCPAFDLCKKRVLIVGGKTRMEALYRHLVESCGGLLEYHDGNVKGGSRQLESRLKRADIILCPVNCNSHGACSLVKNLAKRHSKPVHMMSNFSLNAISRQINESSNLVGVSDQAKGRSMDPLSATL
jgi:predicted transcriptional regulator